MDPLERELSSKDHRRLRKEKLIGKRNLTECYENSELIIHDSLSETRILSKEERRKVRNRKSAQESRDRIKREMNDLKAENVMLSREIEMLRQKLSWYQKRVDNMESLSSTYSNTDSEDSYSDISDMSQYFRSGPYCSERAVQSLFAFTGFFGTASDDCDASLKSECGSDHLTVDSPPNTSVNSISFDEYEDKSCSACNFVDSLPLNEDFDNSLSIEDFLELCQDFSN